jgi:hypothetical protein
MELLLFAHRLSRLLKKPRADVILSAAKDLLCLFSIRNGRCFVRRDGLSMTDTLFQQPVRSVPRAPGFLRVSLAAILLMFATSAPAQDQEDELAPTRVPPAQTQQDAVLSQVAAVTQSVITPDVGALSKALHIGEQQEGAAAGVPPGTLTALGDMDGDGVPEMILKWAMPDVEVAAESTPAPDSHPLWGVYLLCWDGTGWKASRLASGVEDSTVLAINLGKSAGRGIAVVTRGGNPAVAYPSVFQVKDHAALLLWDGQADESRYEPLVQGRLDFHDRGDAPAEMVVTGHADPGLLKCDPSGQRGFTARATYRWDGKGYVPTKIEYSPGRDYTLYRFISALHLHDYRSAYSLIAPAQFLNSDSPTLDAFRQFIQDTWPEFLGDHVFEAVEPNPGSPDENLFALPLPDKQYVYRPIFSRDGKFLLTNLKRTLEALPPESGARDSGFGARAKVQFTADKPTGPSTSETGASPGSRFPGPESRVPSL